MSDTSSKTLKTKFERDGILTPIDILEPQEAESYQKQILDFCGQINWRLNAVNRHKPHMYLKWANDLARHPKIMSAVTEILGPDVLMWYSVVFVKPANSSGEVPWHQDATYWALDRDEGLTVWVALSDVNETNGCVEFIRGSHRGPALGHDIDNREDNMLARGQVVKGFSASETTRAILKPGQASIHHVSTVHASKPNPSNQPRLGIAFRYIKATNYARTLTWLRRSATLVAGETKHRKFIADPIPGVDSEAICRKAHRRSVRVAATHTLFGDAGRSAYRKVMDLAPILLSKKTLSYLRFLKLPVEQSHDS